MQKLSKIHLSLIGALALAACDNVGGGSENNQIRQNKLTISNTPIFPHTGNRGVYALVLSNYSNQELKLNATKLNELRSQDSDDVTNELKTSLNKAQLAKANPINELVDLSACQTIAAASNCIVTIKLPKQVANGYFDFSLDYSDSHDKVYKVDKLIVFNAEMTPTDVVIMSNQYIESVVVNSDKYTLAIPFQLIDDFESIAIRQHGIAPAGYNQIICNNQEVDGKTVDTTSKYRGSNSCTALIELNAHEANPELALAFSDTYGSSRMVEIKSSVLYGNYPELIALGAPLVLRNNSLQEITIRNIGTKEAKNIRLTETDDTTLFSVSKTLCEGKALGNNQECTIQYTAINGSNQTAKMTQVISYSGEEGLGERSFSGKFLIYKNWANPLLAPQHKRLTPHDSNKEFFPEELSSIIVGFDQPVNASGLYEGGGDAMGIVDQTLTGCENISFLTPSTIRCSLSTSVLNSMIGDVEFGLETKKIRNSAGLLKGSQNPRYPYLVRHHRNPRVSTITNTNQTFKPGDTIKFAITLDSSRYNSVANRYRFDAKSGYTITRNGCQTSNSNSCTIELDYKIPAKNQLPDLGQIQHTLPQHLLSIVPSNGTNPSELKVLNSLTVSVVNKRYSTRILADGPGPNQPAGVTWSVDSNPNVQVPNRFVNYGNDCVIDKATGLMWAKSANYSGDVQTWSDAVRWASDIANANKLCGFNKGWHLPTVREQLSIFNYKDPQVRMNWLNSIFTNVSPRFYATSTSFAGNNYTEFWQVDVSRSFDILRPWDKNTRDMVWPVRVITEPGILLKEPLAPIAITGQINCATNGCTSGIEWPNPRFEIVSGDCVIDHFTGLMWLRNANYLNAAKKYTDAQDEVSKVNFCGYKDWRLPMINELNSLMNYGVNNPIEWLNNINTDRGKAFLNIADNYDKYWTSSTFDLFSPDIGWDPAVDFAYAVTLKGNITSGVTNWHNPLNSLSYHSVWPVRTITDR